MRRYRVRLPKRGEYIVHEMSRRDLLDLLPAMQSDRRSDQMAAEDALVARCVEGVEVDTLPAGVVSRLASEVCRLSGLTGDGRSQQQMDEWAASVHGRMEILAMSYLGYRLSELWELPISEWQYVMTAAVVSAAMHGVDVSRFVNREQFEEVRKQATIEQMRAASNVARPVSYNTPSIEKEFEFTWTKGR